MSFAVLGFSVPVFVLSYLLIALFSVKLQLLPVQGYVPIAYGFVPFAQHLILPAVSLGIINAALIARITRATMLEVLNQDYIRAARAKGLSENRILYGHVFRNAMLIIIAGMPAALIGIFFAGSLLIEVIFSLDGLGLLSFEAALSRDYPVVFGTLFIFTLLGLLLKLISDITYRFVDPRIDFESRDD